eukprot:scaffold67160_cov28-Tisochrysis_lutea.AAC.11
MVAGMCCQHVCEWASIEEQLAGPTHAQRPSATLGSKFSPHAIDTHYQSAQGGRGRRERTASQLTRRPRDRQESPDTAASGCRSRATRFAGQAGRTRPASGVQRRTGLDLHSGPARRGLGRDCSLRTQSRHGIDE